jgi:nucleoside-diphosphate-sugar epimerase
MRVLVIGGTGFIGVHVLRELDRRGHEVTVYHRGVHEPDVPAGVRHVRSELAAIPVVDFPAELRGATFDAVVHMVPIGEEDARAAVDVFRGCAGRLVAVSSADVYGAYGRLIGKDSEAAAEAGGEPLDEEAPLRHSLYPYGRSVPSPWGGVLRDYEKILVERAVLGERELPGIVLRLPAVYGPGDRQRRFWPWVRRMHEGRPVIVLGARQARWRWTHGYVENVAAAIALAATDGRALGRTYNVGEAETPSVAERVRALGAAAGWDGRVAVVPDERLPPQLREPFPPTVDLALDTTRLRRELGYEEPVGYEEGLARTVAWLRATADADAAPVDYASEDGAASVV